MKRNSAAHVSREVLAELNEAADWTFNQFLDMVGECGVCGKQYIQYRKRFIYCSDECAQVRARESKLRWWNEHKEEQLGKKKLRTAKQ